MPERIIIVGAGPAGTRAARILAEAGLATVLLDEAAGNGGQIYRRQPPGFRRPYAALYGTEAGKAERLHAALDGFGGLIDHRTDTLVWSLDGRRLMLNTAGRADSLDFDRLILATGAMDRVIPLPGWTLPGVFALGGAQVALKHQACAVGAKTCFVGSSPLLPYVAYQYARAGAGVAGVVDTTPRSAKLGALPDLLAVPGVTARGLTYMAWLARHGIRYWHGATPLRVEGGEHVTALVFRTAGGAERRIDCDAVALGYGLKCEHQLADLAGCAFRFDSPTRQWVVAQDDAGRTSVDGLYVAGDGALIRGADAAELAGERAALALLADLGRPVDAARVAQIGRHLARIDRQRRGMDKAFAYPNHLAQSLADDVILCRCEAVTVGEVRRAVTEQGADDINRAKAFCRVGMGRCQGRVCGPAAADVVAAALGRPIEAAGRLRGQAPVKPVPVAVLAQAELGETQSA
ncbi:MAG: NAD(P)/FAD-dependent oxidoreductase [Rhodospirillaceae bacterium]|nr:NAD(P)/FAD-dependent oxidoreductase [Rhodospirillaceae bacterium]